MGNSQKIKILYLDDEVHNLQSFKASYRFDYDIFLASSADEATQIIEKEPDIEVILSDQRMPGKTGVDFFESIRFDHPRPVRMLITGYSDIEDVVGAVNKGHIFRYIRKPWEESDLVSAIEEAHKYYLANSFLLTKNESLQKAYDELDKFAYRVTHDLKGPIVNTLAALDILKSEPSHDTRVEIINLITKSMIKLDDFVENMFAYYKIRHGEAEINEVDFARLVQTQKDIFGVTIRMNNIDFDYHVDQKMPLRSDEIKLNIIISNLLSNAFKYQKPDNEHKKVSMNIKVEDGQAVIIVSDNGIGIGEQYQKNIFDLFYRATTSEPGSGIGLFNVHDAVIKMNGKITVESETGIGTTFRVIIPGKM